MLFANLVDSDAELSELNLGLLNLRRELLVCVGDVVEGKDAEAETEEEVCAEGDEGPEGEHRDDLLLDQRRKGDELEEERKVERRNQEGERNGLLSASHLGGSFLRSVVLE